MSTYNQVLDEVLNKAQGLTLDEQLQLLEELATYIRRQGKTRPKHSVMEFRGMAKKLWEGVDVDKFIDEEQNSWDG